MGKPFALILNFFQNKALRFFIVFDEIALSVFGEEVVVPLAKRQNNKMKIYSASEPVKRSLDLIASDFNLELQFD